MKVCSYEKVFKKLLQYLKFPTRFTSVMNHNKIGLFISPINERTKRCKNHNEVQQVHFSFQTKCSWPCSDLSIYGRLSNDHLNYFTSFLMKTICLRRLDESLGGKCTQKEQNHRNFIYGPSKCKQDKVLNFTVRH